MLAAIFYLKLTSAKNRVLSRLRRLRQPKYLIGAIVGIAYFYFFFFRHTAHAGSRRALGGVVLPADLSALFLALGAFALMVIFTVLWTAPSDRPGLRFTEAEIAFLFPAPITRRALIHFRLLSAQFSTLLQSLFYALVFNSRTLFSSQALQVIVSWWAVLTLVNLHHSGAALASARLAQRGLSARRRRALLLGAACGIALGSGWSLWQSPQPLPIERDLAGSILTVLESGVLPWLLWPFKLVLQPFFAVGASAFLLALAPVLGLLALHYLWVVRMNVAFEEASLEKAERHGARLAELRRSGTVQLADPRALIPRRAPFVLERARWPEMAFLWKNLLSSSRSWFTPRGWIFAATAIVAVHGLSRSLLGPDALHVSAVLVVGGLFTAGVTLLYGPLLSRLDLRQDLANADLLKTYPLPGWRILLGELLAPIAVLSGIVWLGLLAWYLGLLGQTPASLSADWFGPSMRVVFAICAAVATPVIIAIELLVPNAVPILFPSWFQAVRTPGAGIDLMGQRLIFGFGQVLVVLFALAPAAVGAGLLVFITQWLIGPAAAMIFATLTAIAVLLGELWCGLWWLGRRFERFDLSLEPVHEPR